MIDSGYPGEIIPINPNAEEILGLRCYPSILDVQGEVDLAVVSIPAASVLQVAEECGMKGVKALVVISAGFKETGHEGAVLEGKLVEIAEKYGMRIQGPNCLGLINTSIPLNLSFAAVMPKGGKIGFISQSGALGTAVLDWVIKEEIGFHSFISLGNKADLDEVDFIEAMGEDEGVGVILLYVESIEDGRRFIEVSSSVTQKKPIIVLKGGTSTAGARAAGSHTGALVGSFVAYQTAFEKTGVVMADSVEELFNYAVAFTEQPLPKGEGLAIVTNAGGPGIIATDLSEKLGIRLTSIYGETRSRIMEKLPPAASVGNPIDVLGDAMADRYRFVIEEVLKDDYVNSVLVILTPQAMTESVETARSIVEIQKRIRDKPVIVVFMGGDSVREATEYLRDNSVPCYNFPEKAIKTVSAMYQYARFMKEPEHFPARFKDVDPGNVNAILDAVKIVSPDILHKTDVGGVVLNIRSDEEVRSAYEGILAGVGRYMPEARIYGVMVYRMVPRGREMIIGMSQDIQFGPLVMFGLGGIYVNFLKDVSFRLAPLSEYEARSMMEETRAYTLLKGIRGESPSDVEALKNTILRVGQLVWDFPQIVEMDINPVIVYGEGEGCIALDVKITLTKD